MIITVFKKSVDSREKLKSKRVQRRIGMEQMSMELHKRNSMADGKERQTEKTGENQDELISVIICTYNRVGLLGRSIQSVLSQTYTNLELLIIDDCSTDHTGEFVKGLSDERIRYYRNEKKCGTGCCQK